MAVLNITAIQTDDLTGQIGRTVDKIPYQISDFLRCAETPRRNFFFKGRFFFCAQLGIHARLNRPTCDSIYLNITWSKLFGKRPRKPVDTGFCCGIGGFAGGTDCPHIEEMLIILPDFFDTIFGIASREQ